MALTVTVILANHVLKLTVTSGRNYGFDCYCGLYSDFDRDSDRDRDDDYNFYGDSADNYDLYSDRNVDHDLYSDSDSEADIGQP